MYSAKAFIEKITIENFKSIRRLELRLKPGINLLVGPNASGKTNILEALYFLWRAAVDEPRKTPYTPHAPDYWDPLDLIYEKNPENKISYDVAILFSFKEGYGHHAVLATRVSFRIRLGADPTIGIKPVELAIDYDGDTSIVFREGEAELRIRRNLFETVKEHIAKDYPFSAELLRGARVEDGYLTYTARAEQGVRELPLAVLRFPPRASLFPRIVKGGRATIVYARFLTPFLEDGTLPVIYRLKPRDMQVFRGAPVRLAPSHRLAISVLEVLEVLRGILLLKHPDIGKLREPQPLRETDRLDVRAVNLAPVLYAMLGRYGGLPPRITDAVSELFPGMSLRLELKYGRVALIAEEDGLELPPPNLPDGLFKLLAILTAVELRPSLLLIDEIENSMHRRMIEYVVDVLNSLEIPVLVATHSPLVVDLVGPERTLIVTRKPGEGTTVETVGAVEELRRRLDELGVGFSDYVFYART